MSQALNKNDGKLDELEKQISSLTSQLVQTNKTIEAREIEIVKLENELDKIQTKLNDIKKVIER